MFSRILTLSLFVVLLNPLTINFSFSNEGNLKQTRTVVHLLDYLASDYPAAVQNGRVVNLAEHKEHLELSRSALELSRTVPEMSNDPRIASSIERLISEIRRLSLPSKVSHEALLAKKLIISATRLPLAPKEWPSIRAGKEVFSQNCVQCHGLSGRGDGPQAKKLSPAPSDFYNKDLMLGLSPFRIYNTVLEGIPGTAMIAQPHLTENELWAVAFYVTSLRHGGPQEKLVTNPAFDLELASSQTDAELEQTYPGQVGSIRTLQVESSALSKTNYAKTMLKKALEYYANGQIKEAKDAALSAYLDGIEMIEPKIKATDANLLIEIEEKMGLVRAGIEYKLPMEHLQEKTQIATGVIEKVEKLFSQERSTTSMVFLMSATIILREAFEAVLIVIALLSVLKSTQSKKSLAWVHGGWVAAVIVGVVFWFFSGWAMNLSGANRELLEGALTLVSALVLVYMGFWLHSKTEITKWNRFIKSKIEVALNNKSLLGLSAISFIAVVREALEVVLFLRALWIENTGSSEMQMASIAGVAVAFLLVFVLSILMLRFAEKVPIRKLFNFSSAAMAVLAVIMMGKALHAIQAAGKLEITFLPVNWRFEALGFYPTIETVAGQLGLVILLVMLWYWGNRPVISKSQNQTA